MGVDFETLVTAWKKWVQAGVAFGELIKSVQKFSPKELANAVKDEQVERGELLWQAGEFCVADAIYRRDPKTKALVHPLSGAAQKKIVGSWLVPVVSLLKEPDLLTLHESVRKLLIYMIYEVRAADTG